MKDCKICTDYGYKISRDGYVLCQQHYNEVEDLFRQLDEILEEAGLNKNHLCSARLYLQHVNRDIAEVNKVWAEYLGDHPVNRRAYGVDLQNVMLVEAGFVAEFPA